MDYSKKQKDQWQAESDAMTLASYQEIISDKARMSRAVREARKQADNLSKRTNAMQKAASTGARKSVRKK